MVRLRLLSIFIVILSLTLYAVYWKVDRDYFAEKMTWNETQSRSQLAALTQAVQAEIEGQTQILDLSVPLLLQNKTFSYGADQAYSQFHMIAKLSGSKAENIFFLSDSSVKTWGEAQIAALGSDDSVQTLKVYKDSSQKKWVLARLHSRITQDNYAVILEPNFLQALIDREKGQAGSFFIINDHFQVLSHVEPEYIGMDFNEDALSQQAISSGTLSGSGLFEGVHSEKVHGFFEKVEGANIFVEVQTPLRVLLAEKTKLSQRFLYLGLGMLFLGVCLLMLLEGQKETVSDLSQSATVHQKSGEVAKAADPQSRAPEKTKSAAGPAQTEKLSNQKAPMAAPQKRAAAGKVETSASTKIVASAPEKILEPVKSEPMSKDLPQPVVKEKKLPPPPESRGPVEQKFEDLFADRKIKEAFEAIDSIESPPPVPRAVPQVPESTKMDVAEVHTAPPPPPPPPASSKMDSGVSMALEVGPKPQIELAVRESKLDQVVVKIRKPKVGSAQDVE